jgi:CheY-like chemotaxis protein
VTAQSCETILLVEDEDVVRHVTREVLESGGYRVLTAENGNEALKIFDAFPEHIDLLVTDIVMPGMNGCELARTLERRCAGIKILFMSGYTDNALAGEGFSNPSTAYLQKPFSVAALISKVRELISQTNELVAPLAPNTLQPSASSTTV